MTVCKCVLCAAIMVSSAAAVAQTSAQPATTKPAEATTRAAAPAGLSDRAAAKSGKQAADPAMATRDWAAIDKNKDNLISPEEMEAYLKANPGPLAKAR